MAPNLKEVKPLTESQHNSRLIRRKTNLKKKQKQLPLRLFCMTVLNTFKPK